LSFSRTDKYLGLINPYDEYLFSIFVMIGRDGRHVLNLSHHIRLHVKTSCS